MALNSWGLRTHSAAALVWGNPLQTKMQAVRFAEWTHPRMYITQSCILFLYILCISLYYNYNDLFIFVRLRLYSLESYCKASSHPGVNLGPESRASAGPFNPGHATSRVFGSSLISQYRVGR